VATGGLPGTAANGGGSGTAANGGGPRVTAANGGLPGAADGGGSATAATGGLPGAAANGGGSRTAANGGGPRVTAANGGLPGAADGGGSGTAANGGPPATAATGGRSPTAATGLSGRVLARFGRIPLAVVPTPLVAAPRLGAALGCGPLLVKRDDLTGFAFGGNKARPLEFLLAAALADGADTLLTGGAASSNFCAAAAAAACRAGLRCELVIAGHPVPPVPALALALSWGAAVRWTGVPERDSVDAGLPAAAAELSAQGRRAYLIPRGGATALGALGYALAAAELHDQLGQQGLRADVLIVPTGSGGTLAGLVAGNVLLGRPWRLVGCSASRPPEATVRRVTALAAECLGAIEPPDGAAAGAQPVAVGPAAVGPADVTVADARGPGHGIASADGTAAQAQAMRTEGLLVDPVYTAKALALVPQYSVGGNVVFWHTGGVLDAVAEAQDRA
jgi:1-aminocyclopropane-1-carboxylate deaminase/D-cysteine desulfhydrase-like pyridoxal-dependent ACC family enzyme